MPRRLPTALFLIAALLALRLFHLRAMPVFCDEATYLRWAQLVRAHPIQNAFVSMQDGKFPLHYWLLALAWPLHSDPVYMGRLLSVFFAALTIPALLALCSELRKISAAPASFGVIAAILFITSPYIAMNQRMAIAEPLLLLEAITLAWLSFRLARRIINPVTNLLPDALLLGLLWAATLLTKQNFSYALWIFPLIALLITLKPNNHWQQFKRFIPPYILATAIGIAFFIPALFAKSPLSILSRLLYKIDQASAGLVATTAPSRNLLLDNAKLIFLPAASDHLQWWPHDPYTPLTSGWLYLYLTPPVLLLALAGSFLLFKKDRRILLFLAIWLLVLLGPLLPAVVAYSRYALLGIIPFLLAAAWTLSHLISHFRSRIATAVLVIIAIAWPLTSIIIYAADPHAPMLVEHDRWQHVAGYPCGDAAQRAVEWLQQRASQKPIIVVTTNEFGAQIDLPWLLLRDNPNILLLWSDTTPPLPATSADTVIAGTDQWLPDSKTTITLPHDRDIFFIGLAKREPPDGPLDFYPALDSFHGNASVAAEFFNPPSTPDTPPTAKIVLIRFNP